MFGDFLNRGKHGQLDFENIDDLEDGTPIVARYNNREFQFGIYGEGYVIYQDCWQTKAGVLVFSLEQSSIEGFFEDSTVYEYTPDFEFDKKKAYYNARRNFSEPGNSVWGWFHAHVYARQHRNSSLSSLGSWRTPVPLLSHPVDFSTCKLNN